MRQTKRKVSPMSNEGRNAYVIKHLTEALLDLLSEKSLEDILISELIEKAGVGKASFYRNFDSKEDILRRHTDSITMEFVKTQKIKYDTKHFREYTVMLFEHLENNKNFCLILLNNHLLHIIGDVFDKYFLKNATTYDEQYKQMFASGGFYNIFKFWLMGGCKESPEELSDMFLDYM